MQERKEDGADCCRVRRHERRTSRLRARGSLADRSEAEEWWRRAMRWRNVLIGEAHFCFKYLFVNDLKSLDNPGRRRLPRGESRTWP